MKYHVLADSLTQSLPHAHADNTAVQSVLSIMFGLAGALAFLMIVISGLRYIIAQDDAQKVAQAKRGVIYSVIGLVVAASGEIIVAFVIGNLHT
jgi:hypothetical protein